MTRLLIFLMWLVLLAFTVTVLMSFDNRISGEAFGLRFDAPSSVIIGIVGFLFLVAIYLTHKIKDILAMPAKMRAQNEKSKRERGVAALTRGLEAIASGDAADAAHHARVAQKHLQDTALTRLLTAQSAQLTGDEATATQSFTAMLDAPETEFLGLKGLYAQAIKDGDQDKAKRLAERAFTLRANAAWAFRSVVDLGLERGAWRETREAIDKGRRNSLIEADKANRARAALYTAEAYSDDQQGDKRAALVNAESALKLAPDFTPAAILAAQLHAEQKRNGKAASILEAAFALRPHPAIIRLYDKTYSDLTADKRAVKLTRLADKNTDCDEASLLRARAFNITGEYADAMTVLEKMIAAGPNAHAYALMATSMGGLYGADVGRGWLERAADTPRDPRPGADGQFHFTREGWARLIVEYMDHNRLAPPPLEEAAAAISTEELRLLTAPPPVEESAPEDIEEQSIEHAHHETAPSVNISDSSPGIGPDEKKSETAEGETDASNTESADAETAGQNAAAAARTIS